jgi:hypothetical protein
LDHFGTSSEVKRVQIVSSKANLVSECRIQTNLSLNSGVFLDFMEVSEQYRITKEQFSNMFCTSKSGEKLITLEVHEKKKRMLEPEIPKYRNTKRRLGFNKI